MLHVAAEEGNVGVMEYLIERAFINPEIRDVDGDTPFHAAARAGGYFFRCVCGFLACVQQASSRHLSSLIRVP